MSIDTKIKELFDKLNEKKAAVKALEAVIDRKWQTNGEYVIPGTDKKYTLTVCKLPELALIVSSIHALKSSDAAVKALTGFTNAEIHKIDYDKVLADVSKRAATLSINEEKAKLNELEKRLEAVVSPEQRRQMEVEALTSLLT